MLVSLAYHERRGSRCPYVKVSSFRTDVGKPGTDAVVLVPLRTDAIPQDAEELLAMVLADLSLAVYHS